MSCSSLLDRRAALDPQGRAVSDASRTFSNAELLGRVQAAASHLTDLGIGPRDVVALKLVNRVEFIVLLFATWRIGATITPVNPSLTAGEVARQVADSGSSLMVVEPGAQSIPDSGVPGLDVDEMRKVAEPGGARDPYVDPSALARSSTRVARPAFPKASCSTTPTSTRWLRWAGTPSASTSPTGAC